MRARTAKPTSAPPASIDQYIAGFPEDVQEVLEQVRTAIRRAAPDAEEAIRYGIPTFLLAGNLVHFGGFKKHVGFYPAPSGIAKFKTELAAYESAKGSVRLPLDEPIPLKLIERIVKFRVGEVRAEQKAVKKEKN